MTGSADSPRRLGCGGHLALFLLAWMVTCTAVFREAARDAAATGRSLTPDSMGLLWPAAIPFVYLGLVGLHAAGRLIVGAVRRAMPGRHTGP